MKPTLHFFFVCVAALAIFQTGCSKSTKDKIIKVEDDDKEMNAAITHARETLPHFWQTYEKREHGESDFGLKVRITDAKGVEHFWLNNIERKDGKIWGIINNDPDIVTAVKLGDRIPVPEADISD